MRRANLSRYKIWFVNENETQFESLMEIFLRYTFSLLWNISPKFLLTALTYLLIYLLTYSLISFLDKFILKTFKTFIIFNSSSTSCSHIGFRAKYGTSKLS